MTRTSDDVFEERADIGVGLDDQNPCHVRIMSPGAGIGSAREYEYGVSESARILVVDDEEDIRSLLRELLQRAGYRVEEAPDGRAALRRLSETQPALVLLDVSMPELDGYQTLARIRDLSDVPVIMLTARTQELERVRGLASGADDYVSKPFGRQELLARIQALLRRSGGKAEVTESYRDGFVEIDYQQRRVLVDEREVTLTPLEFKLLSAFVQHPNTVLSREQLLELVWGDPYGVSGDQVKLYVGYLRKKLDPEMPARSPVETVRGFGYRYKRIARAGQPADDLDQLGRLKGLREVRVGARLEPARDVGLLGAGRKEHDSQIGRLGVGTQCSEHVGAGQARHHHVEYHHRGRSSRATDSASSPSDAGATRKPARSSRSATSARMSRSSSAQRTSGPLMAPAAAPRRTTILRRARSARRPCRRGPRRSPS